MSVKVQVFVGVLLRVVLFRLGVFDWLGKRIELTTPLNQWYRLQEGLALLHRGQSPYEGDTCHETPLVLLYFNALTSLGQWAVYLHYIIVDLLICYALHRLVFLHHRRMVNDQSEEQYMYGKGCGAILIRLDRTLQDFVVSLYLLNPLTLLVTSSLSTGNLSNLFIALTLCSAIQGSPVLSAVFLACSSYLSLYPLALVVPLVLIAYETSGILGAVRSVVAVAVSIAGLLGLSYYITQSWDFLNAVYGIILLVPDLTPNYGLFWYFFTEMFDHFRLFFLCVFQINAFIMSIPLSIRFHDQPVFVFCLVVSLTSVFKSYPSFGDVLLPLAFLPLWAHLYRNMRFTLAIVVMFIISIILGPVFYHLWTSTGSINSNFYFSMTLVYSLAQIFLVSDLAYSQLIYLYDLQHGWPRVDKNGQTIKLKLS
jgi:phosphatidylinositol glycan class U